MDNRKLSLLLSGQGGNLGLAPITSVSGNTTLDGSYHTVLVDASGGAVTITLPAAASNTKRIYVIKKIDSSQNPVTVDPNASELIDNDSTVVINSQWNAISIHCNGTKWLRI